MILKRHTWVEAGIFGDLHDGERKWACTLEHSYGSGIEWNPKLPAGLYECVRGMHQLKGMVAPFETFEVTNVPGHSGILFHVGNFNDDSEGCILLGRYVMGNMLMQSRMTFLEFMKEMEGIDSFPLTVE